MIELGTEVTDPVTGYKGIVVSKSVFLYGCTRIGVQAKKDKNGEIPRIEWFDEPQLIVGKKKIKSADDINKDKRNIGGPMLSIPTRNSANQ